MSSNKYLHQTFTKCVSNWLADLDVLICQMQRHVMESLLMLLHFLAFFIHNWWPIIVVSPPNFHILCVWLKYIFWYVNMPNGIAVLVQILWFNCVLIKKFIMNFLYYKLIKKFNFFFWKHVFSRFVIPGIQKCKKNPMSLQNQCHFFTFVL